MTIRRPIFVCVLAILLGHCVGCMKDQKITVASTTDSLNTIERVPDSTIDILRPIR